MVQASQKRKEKDNIDDALKPAKKSRKVTKHLEDISDKESSSGTLSDTIDGQQSSNEVAPTTTAESSAADDLNESSDTIPMPEDPKKQTPNMTERNHGSTQGIPSSSDISLIKGNPEGSSTGITMQRVILDLHQIPDCDTNVIARLESMANYFDPQHRTYAIDLLPADVTWGARLPWKADMSNIVCSPDTNQPFIVWMVGRVSRKWFYNKKDEPQPHVSINIVPLTDGTSARVRQLLQKLSQATDQSLEDGWGDIRFSRWMTTHGQGNEQTVNGFFQCYDARDVYKAAKHKMPSFSIRDINDRDIVLVEAHISRFPIKSSSGQWGRKAYLELKSISLISQAPPVGSVTAETDASGDEDVHI